jgi:hypothetical protein
MTTWRCLIKTPSGLLRWTEVEAVNYQDAVALAQQVNPGDVVNCFPKGSRYEGDLYAKSSSNTGLDGDAIMGFLSFCVILFVIYVAITAWPILLACGALYLAFKILTA